MGISVEQLSMKRDHSSTFVAPFGRWRSNHSQILRVFSATFRLHSPSHTLLPVVMRMWSRLFLAVSCKVLTSVEHKILSDSARTARQSHLTPVVLNLTRRPSSPIKHDVTPWRVSFGKLPLTCRQDPSAYLYTFPPCVRNPLPEIIRKICKISSLLKRFPDVGATSTRNLRMQQITSSPEPSSQNEGKSRRVDFATSSARSVAVCACGRCAGAAPISRLGSDWE